MKLAALLVPLIGLGACGGRPDATPLPTRQTTIEPVMKKLDAAARQEQQRREEMDDAAR